MIHLEKIDASNAWDIMDLKVARSQREFVASNTESIATAYVAIGTGCTAFHLPSTTTGSRWVF